MKTNIFLQEYLREKSMIDLDQESAIDYELFSCKQNLDALYEQFGNKRAKKLSDAICSLIIDLNDVEPELNEWCESYEGKAILRSLGSKLLVDSDSVRLPIDEAKHFLINIKGQTSLKEAISVIENFNKLYKGDYNE